MKSRLSNLFSSKYFRLILGLAVSALTLYLALRNVDFQEVGQAIAQADLRLLGLALVSVLVNNLIKVVRWQLLFGQEWQGLPFSKLTQSLLSGQMLNIIYPARVGDLSRIYVIGGLGPGRVFTLGTIFLEKLLDMLFYVLLFILLILLIPLPAWVNDSVLTVALVVLLASFAALLFSARPAWLLRLVERLLGWLPERIGSYLLARFQSALDSLEILKNRPGLVKLVFWSALIWATAILNNFLVLLALKIYLPWTASLLILMVLQAGISLPSAPGRFGIFEYSCILALAVYGVDQASALSYGLILHAVVFFPVILLGMVSFWMLGLDRKQAEIMATLSESAPLVSSDPLPSSGTLVSSDPLIEQNTMNSDDSTENKRGLQGLV